MRRHPGINGYGGGFFSLVVVATRDLRTESPSSSFVLSLSLRTYAKKAAETRKERRKEQLRRAKEEEREAAAAAAIGASMWVRCPTFPHEMLFFFPDACTRDSPSSVK